MKTKIVTDIGGVLLPDSFSKKTLMQDFEQNGPRYIQTASQEDLAFIEKIAEKAGSREAVVDYVVQQLMAKNKDSLFLDLMGRVNLASLNAGRVKVEFYPDVPEALAKWRSAGQRAYTYSNGTSEFQRAMFRAASCGDLSATIAEFFDTAVIGKKDRVESYEAIADRLETSPRKMEYFSDDTSELEAAAKAGCRVYLVDRDNKHPDLPRLTSLI